MVCSEWWVSTRANDYSRNGALWGSSLTYLTADDIKWMGRVWEWYIGAHDVHSDWDMCVRGAVSHMFLFWERLIALRQLQFEQTNRDSLHE
jgi:hypothetical protein